ncbi:MAG: PQQ-dependent sugar dehydrogenase [Bacteroidetes bacterium SB0662_bin_6]|nr:PQQ-dependent sugar dehydrogenase [Bacteroidetes bacterium SB0668_bin_1]MYE03826.1 PQQ-dependent sugar dehydrogenase [Bacteroidetes bacterium SB0662_bin_6]
MPICCLVLLFLGASACGLGEFADPEPVPEEGELQLEEPFPALRFTRPVDFQIPGDGSGRIFVVEQAGVIKVFDNRSDIGSADTFLDIKDRVRDQGNEEGLLGLAFHPEFATNGYFFVDYTASDPRRTVVARYSVDPNDPDRALPGSETVILEVAQPYGNHNAGQIVFGPGDGYLYVTLGDGGSAGDPQDNSQDPTTLLGAILRIDVDGESPYAIPPDNPFAGNTEGYREEIYAYGLRNPWRISFDLPTGRLWAADVGQHRYEEVHIIEAGKNYGWDIIEGMHCYEPSTGCDQEGLEPPVWEYSHDFGISITGGFVYHGDLAPSLAGRYVFADYGTGRIWALAWDGAEAEVEEIMNTSLAISSFGVDAQQELYALAFNGRIYRFTEQSPDP